MNTKPSAAVVAGPRARARTTPLRWGLMAAVGVSVAGCGSIAALTSSEALRVEPVLRMDSYDAQAAYTAGKHALSSGLSSLALASFERALVVQPGWADAENGRVVALARLGRTAQAIQLAQAAVSAGTASPELQNNLVLLLRRQGGQQQVAQTPGSVSAVSAASMDTIVAAPAAIATQPSAAAVAAVATIGSLSPPPALRWAESGPNVLELQRHASSVPRPVEQALPALPTLSVPFARTASQPVAPGKPAQIEVSNGAGLAGLARSTAEALRSPQITPRRITNHSHFNVPQTEIQYRGPESSAAARNLASSFAFAVRLAAKPELRAGIDVRVLLGRDAAALTARSQPLTLPQQAAAATRTAQVVLNAEK